MLTVQCNGICECSNENGSDGCSPQIIDLHEENDYFLKQLSLECKDGKCLCADRFYQRFTNVCRRESIPNENFNNADSIDNNSISVNSNCTSIGTQTKSLRDATIQTISSLDSLTESPSDCHHKFGSFANRHIRNYINYNRLDQSDGTKGESSLESSVKDESTQFSVNESWDSDNKNEYKSYPGHRYSQLRKYCHCNDPFCPRDGTFKNELDNVVEDEIYFANGNFNPKSNRCTHVCCPEIQNNFLRRPQQHIYYSQPSQCAPPPPSLIQQQQQQYVPSSTLICPCYSFIRYNSIAENCDLKQFAEKSNANIKVNEIIDNSQRNISNLSYAQQQLPQQQIYETGATKKQLESRAFENADYKIEILNETMKKNQFSDNFTENKCIEKDYDESHNENEQSKPLLNKINDDNDEKNDCFSSSTSSENLVDIKNENAEDETTQTQNECHCHYHHDFSPDTNQQNGIRVRPSNKKSSKSTSPLKIITLLLFASAFLITGSALKDAYYP